MWLYYYVRVGLGGQALRGHTDPAALFGIGAAAPGRSKERGAARSDDERYGCRAVRSVDGRSRKLLRSGRRAKGLSVPCAVGGVRVCVYAWWFGGGFVAVGRPRTLRAQP